MCLKINEILRLYPGCLNIAPWSQNVAFYENSHHYFASNNPKFSGFPKIMSYLALGNWKIIAYSCLW